MAFLGPRRATGANSEILTKSKRGGARACFLADTDLAYDNINAWQQGSRGGTYTVQAGDTLSGIAAALWGDANLWYKIAEVNGLTAESQLIEGMPLLIPVGVVRTSNTAETFKPYDPPGASGDSASGVCHLYDLPRPAEIIPNNRLSAVAGRPLIYVVRQDGVLVIGRESRNGHIDLAGGGPVRAAGRLQIAYGGKLVRIDNHSGHYQPSGASARHQAETAFQRLGYDTTGKYVEEFP